MKIQIKHIELAEQKNISAEPGILELEDRYLHYKTEMFSDFYDEETALWRNGDYAYMDMYVLKSCITGVFVQYSTKNDCWKVSMPTTSEDEGVWFFFSTKEEAEGVLESILDWLLDKQGGKQ